MEPTRIDRESSLERARPRRRKSFKRVLMSHVSRIALIVISIFFNHDFVFAFVGWLNRRWRFLETLFLVYPATYDYYLAYAYEFQRKPMAWSPWPCLLFRQEGKWGLMVSISSTEEEFTKPENRENLIKVVNRVERIRQLIGASQKTFAGILPGFLCREGILDESPETEVTVEAVARAEAEVRAKLGYPADVPLVVLGGRGFIGRRLVARLEGREIHSVDLQDGEVAAQWPEHLRSRKAILINVTRAGSLRDYMDRFWPELVLLNEVYPPPKREELQVLWNIGCHAFHVVGVVARAYPSFPRAYEGGIPCCAARKTEAMRVIVKRLAPDGFVLPETAAPAPRKELQAKTATG